MLQAVDEVAGRAILAGAGALHEIAGNHHEIGRRLLDAVQQRLHQVGLRAAEVQIGQKSEPHQDAAAVSSAGQRTMMASWRTVNR